MLRLETLILKEPLWNSDWGTESHPKLQARAILPCHKFLLPDFSQCCLWRSCGIGNSEHILIGKRGKQGRILLELAFTIINQQSSHFRNGRCSTWMRYPSGKKTQKWVSESGSSLSCAKCSCDGQTEYSSPLCLMHFSFRFLEFSLTQVRINTHFQTLCTFVYWDTSLVGSPHSPARCIDKWVSRILKTFPVWSIYGCKQVTPKVSIFEEPSTLNYLAVSVDGEFGSSSARAWFGVSCEAAVKMAGWAAISWGIGWLKLDDRLPRQLAHVTALSVWSLLGGLSSSSHGLLHGEECEHPANMAADFHQTSDLRAKARRKPHRLL